MPFELHIRHNIPAGADHFTRGEVRSFDQDLVRVGRHSECECRLDAPEFADVHFHILAGHAGDSARLCPAPEQECFLNEQAATRETALQSGDEIRVGHWTLNFQQVFARVGQARKSDVVALTARVLVAAILLSEVAVVLWLPWALKSARAWEAEIAALRVVMVLDHLRARVDDADAADELAQAAWQTVGHELDSLARFVREHDKTLTRSQLQAVLDDLNAASAVMERLESGTAFQPIPALDVNGGVRAALGLVR